MDGCSRTSRRWERLQDDLVERTVDGDRLTHHAAVDQARLEGFTSARAETREAVSRLDRALPHTTAASPLLGGADTHRAWPLYIAGGSEPPLVEPLPPGRTHRVESIVGETVEL